MKKIGMIVAVEMKAVLERYGTPQEEKEYPGYRVLVYEAEDYIIYALNCGAGEIAAAAATQFLISQMQVDFIVNFGVVGGLTEEMTKTKMCVVESVVHYDFDTTEVDAVEVGRYLTYPDIYIPTTPDLVEKAENLQPDLKRVVCASGDKFIGNPEKKKEMHRVFGAGYLRNGGGGDCPHQQPQPGCPALLLKIVSDSVSEERRSSGGNWSMRRRFVWILWTRSFGSFDCGNAWPVIAAAQPFMSPGCKAPASPGAGRRAMGSHHLPVASDSTVPAGPELAATDEKCPYLTGR